MVSSPGHVRKVPKPEVDAFDSITSSTRARSVTAHATLPIFQPGSESEPRFPRSLHDKAEPASNLCYLRSPDAGEELVNFIT
jgi:hypothetical protein